MKKNLCPHCGVPYQLSELDKDLAYIQCESCRNKIDLDLVGEHRNQDAEKARNQDADKARKKDATLIMALLVAIIIVGIGLLGLFIGRPIFMQRQVDQQIETMKPQLADLAGEVSAQLAVFLENSNVWAQKLQKISIPNDKLDAASKLAIEAELQTYFSSNPNFIYTFVGLESKEMVIIPETELPPDYDPTSRPWYAQAAFKSEPQFTGAYQDASTGEWFISTMMPLLKTDASQGIIGVLGADVNLSQILMPILQASEAYKTVAQNQGENPSMQFILADKTGLAIEHTTQALMGNLVTIPDLQTALVANQSAVINYNYLGDSYTAVIEKVEGSDFLIVVTFKNSIGQS